MKHSDETGEKKSIRENASAKEQQFNLGERALKM